MLKVRYVAEKAGASCPFIASASVSNGYDIWQGEGVYVWMGDYEVWMDYVGNRYKHLAAKAVRKADLSWYLVGVPGWLYPAMHLSTHCLTPRCCRDSPPPQ